METQEKIKVALIRGDSLNDWEGSLWSGLGNDFSVTAFCSRKNLYRPKLLPFDIVNLRSSTDSRLASYYERYVNGCFQKMYGLEDKIKGFDILHTAEIFYGYTNQAVRAKQINPKIKVVATIWDNSFGRFEYNYWPGFSMPPKYWRNKLNSIIKENIAGVDLFLPVSEFSKQMLLDYGVTEDKIKILVPAVVDNASESQTIQEIEDLDGKELYLSISRLVKEKGVYDLLYGWKVFAKENDGKTLLIIGDGPEKRNLVRLVEEYGLGESVRFISYLPNNKLKLLYSKSRCLVLASLPTPLWQEQFGYVLAEAISNGCPVIGAASGAIPEVIGDAGLLVYPGNPLAIKDALIKISDPSIFDKLKEECNKRQSVFSIDKFRINLIDIYKGLLS